jgi:Phosphomannose isomerase type I
MLTPVNVGAPPRPQDVGVLAAYFLNVVTLAPGQAMYLPANEPHAYVSGELVEAMAASDNVIRAGLTPKLRDTSVLCSSLTYSQARCPGFPCTLGPGILHPCTLQRAWKSSLRCLQRGAQGCSRLTVRCMADAAAQVTVVLRHGTVQLLTFYAGAAFSGNASEFRLTCSLQGMPTILEGERMSDGVTRYVPPFDEFEVGKPTLTCCNTAGQRCLAPEGRVHTEDAVVLPCVRHVRFPVITHDTSCCSRGPAPLRAVCKSRGRLHGMQVRRIEVPAGSKLSVAADPGPQLLLVQRGRGAATPDSAFQHPEVQRSLLLLVHAGVCLGPLLLAARQQSLWGTDSARLTPQRHRPRPALPVRQHAPRASALLPIPLMPCPDSRRLFQQYTPPR